MTFNEAKGLKVGQRVLRRLGLEADDAMDEKWTVDKPIIIQVGTDGQPTGYWYVGITSKNISNLGPRRLAISTSTHDEYSLIN